MCRTFDLGNCPRYCHVNWYLLRTHHIQLPMIKRCAWKKKKETDKHCLNSENFLHKYKILNLSRSKHRYLKLVDELIMYFFIYFLARLAVNYMRQRKIIKDFFPWDNALWCYRQQLYSVNFHTVLKIVVMHYNA